MSDVLAIADHRRGEIRDVSFELITAARELVDTTGGTLHMAVISGGTEAFADQLNRAGVDVIHTIEYGDEFNHDVYTQATEALYQRLAPEFVLIPNSVNGLDYAPAVAQRLDRPYVSDAVGLRYSDSGLSVNREMYGGKVETTVEISNGPFVVSVRSGEWAATEEDGDAEIHPLDFAPDDDAIHSTVTGFEEVADGDVDIAEAEFLVSIGRGIGEKDNLPLIEELVEAAGATLSASRPIVDNEWLPKNRQVGQSGKQVAPQVYLAIGISGAVQHVAGMKNAETIIAINSDPNAPIYDIADYGIVGDLFDVVPLLTEQFS